MSEDENSIKIILVGETGTGKSNLINVCCNLQFNPNSPSNISCSSLEKKIIINNIEYNIKLWDTAGQEKFRSLNNLFIKDAKICIFVYDNTDRKTFEDLNFWVKTVDELLGKEPILGIVANKSDLILKEKVQESEGKEYAKKIGASFYKTSAKEDKVGFSNYINKLVEEYLTKNNLIGWEFYSKDNIDNNVSNKISLNNSSKNNKKKSKNKNKKNGEENLCYISY
jgi:small GTP-binding protein